MGDAAFNVDPGLRQIPLEPVKLVVCYLARLEKQCWSSELWAFQTSLGAL